MRSWKAYAIRVSLLGIFVVSLHAQGFRPNDGPQDPGVRGGTAGSGQPLAQLTTAEMNFFKSVALPIFSEIDNADEGLGPRFNLDSCAGCHAFPAVGGSSPALNPQVVRAPTMAPGNTIPSFLTLRGPIREVRFIRNPDGTPDGGVHGIFTISGRADKPRGCNVTQPNFSNTSNLSFRIPTPTFGAGLIESITDATIRSNLASDPNGQKRNNGISGRLNTNGNDGTITRFGWKAQNKSLFIFAGEAYNVEQGVTNELFPSERDDDPNCVMSGPPESDSDFQFGLTGPSDLVAQRAFMRFLDQPTPACTGAACSQSIQDGRTAMIQVGCMLCHTEVLTTGISATAALSQKQARLFSDLAVHRMGNGLSDGITQGLAGPDEFRTAPLWGIGQRIFFLHDGRTSDLLQAILAHQSQGSEANRVIDAFKNLRNSQQQNVLNFLRSL